MPVTCGTRLERLEALARQVAVEIELERRALLADAGGRIVGRKLAEPLARSVVRRKSDRSTKQRLEDLGLTAYDVKCWAVNTGLIPAIVRGRISGDLIDAWIDAHATGGLLG